MTRALVLSALLLTTPQRAGTLGGELLERNLPAPPAAPVESERRGEKVPGTDLWMDRSIEDVKIGARPGTIQSERLAGGDDRACDAANGERAPYRFEMIAAARSTCAVSVS
ncbi:MAG TPA: hypothetical protein VEL51_20320, partial [Vicinamibacterales bacterium]|nr:hypothetical protein [Vicinamibacterales bacterium]